MCSSSARRWAHQRAALRWPAAGDLGSNARATCSRVRARGPAFVQELEREPASALQIVAARYSSGRRFCHARSVDARFQSLRRVSDCALSLRKEGSTQPCRATGGSHCARRKGCGAISAPRERARGTGIVVKLWTKGPAGGVWGAVGMSSSRERRRWGCSLPASARAGGGGRAPWSLALEAAGRARSVTVAGVKAVVIRDWVSREPPPDPSRGVRGDTLCTFHIPPPPRRGVRLRATADFHTPPSHYPQVAFHKEIIVS